MATSRSYTREDRDFPMEDRTWEEAEHHLQNMIQRFLEGPVVP